MYRARSLHCRKFTRSRKLPYLVTYSMNYGSHAEPCARLMSMQEIANLIGFSDCNDCSDVRVYRLSINREPELLTAYDVHFALTVELYDQAGFPVDSAEYADH